MGPEIPWEIVDGTPPTEIISCEIWIRTDKPNLPKIDNFSIQFVPHLEKNNDGNKLNSYES